MPLLTHNWLLQGRADPAAFLMVSGKATAAKAGDMLALFRDILLDARLDDQARFKQARHISHPRLLST